jgi:hypothetical protein
MLKNAVLVMLAVACVWLAAMVVRLENYHYASFVGMCGPRPPEGDLDAHRIRHTCLHETQTRTSPVWHLHYALKADY